MPDETESTASEAETATENDTQTTPRSHLARRSVLSLLGATGLGMVGSQSVAANPRPGDANPRPWKRDVNAKGHELRNLGALQLAQDSRSVTNFEGGNLSIDEAGSLHAPTPSARGWGASGEKVPLYSRQLFNFNHSLGRETEFTNIGTPVIIPFDSYSYTNITQIYASIVGWVGWPETEGTATIGISEVSPDQSPLPESSHELNEEGLFHTPKFEYDPGELTYLYAVIQTSPDPTIFRDGTLFIWGEIE